MSLKLAQFVEAVLRRIEGKNIMSFIKSFFALALSVFLGISNGVANPDVAEIQRRFNAETINRPFSVPDDASLTNALKEATQRGTPTRTTGIVPPCVGLGCTLGLGRNIGYGGFFGGYPRPYYGGLYGSSYYSPYYYGW